MNGKERAILGLIFNRICRKILANQVMLFCALVLISVFLLTLSKQSCIKDRPHFTDPKGAEFADKKPCPTFTKVSVLSFVAARCTDVR